MRMRLIIILIATFLPLTSQAVTIEAVLRGLQERYMVIAMRRSFENPQEYIQNPALLKASIVWPHQIPPFPTDGSVTNMQHAIAALNLASRVYDHIKYEFTAYNVANKQFANLSYDFPVHNYLEPSAAGDGFLYGRTQPTTSISAYPKHLILPSVGHITETNWSDTLELASNIDQLITLPWFVKPWY